MYIIQNINYYKKRGVVLPRGGARTGAGRPKGQGKFGEKTGLSGMNRTERNRNELKGIEMRQNVLE